ncbi:hypothetical protein FACS1894172_11810 [Spirochaetia bacterium]|nr:hypothetical protein FACS1894172_11810 [Spirochaetia bacterium]
MKKGVFLVVLLAVLVMGCVTGGGSGAGNSGGSTARRSSKVYVIGDTGPAGGLIFYDKGDYSDGWRYLEVAPVTTETTAQWRHDSGVFGYKHVPCSYSKF